MTATVHLTDTQLAQYTARGLIVVDGEPLPPIEMPRSDVWSEPTGEMIWMAHPPDCHGAFEDRAVAETRYTAALPVGAQSGTYWKSTQFHDGMRVWWWGGIHPVDFKAGWYASDWRHIPKGVDRWNRPNVAPELWRKLTEPCATCHGSGLSAEDSWITQGRAPCPNPDCDRGRQVVTLTATCPTYGDTHIGGNGQVRAVRGSAVCVPDGTGACESDPPCERGVVTLGRFTIRLLPVVVDLDAAPEGTTFPILYVDRESGTAWVVRAKCVDDRQVALDPPPQPGQWAVQFEPVAALIGYSPPARPPRHRDLDTYPHRLNRAAGDVSGEGT